MRVTHMCASRGGGDDITRICHRPQRLHSNTWILAPAPCCSSSPRPPRAAHACCRPGGSEDRRRLCVLVSFPPGSSTSSASVLLIKDPSVSRWRQPCTAELSTQSVQKQAKKHLNMETHLSRTNERTAASKLVSPIGRLNSEPIFRSHVTGVYHCRAKIIYSSGLHTS